MKTCARCGEIKVDEEFNWRYWMRPWRHYRYFSCNRLRFWRTNAYYKASKGVTMPPTYFRMSRYPATHRYAICLILCQRAIFRMISGTYSTAWKIENENNNTLKTKGNHLEHNFGQGKQHLSNVLITFNLFAFLLHTVQEITNPVYQSLRQALGTRKTFFNDLRALTRYLLFDDWDALFHFMADGLTLPRTGLSPVSRR